MTSLNDLLEAAKAAPAPTSDPIDVVIGGELVTLQFSRADGKRWAAVCARNPMRIDTPIDRSYGYNFHAAAIEISAETGVRLVDGGPEKLTAEQWRAIFADNVLSGHDFERIVDAVWALNEWAPQQKVAALKKASLVVSEPNSV